MKCHYEVLGVTLTAGDDDIKKAYRKLALRWHPDKNLDNPHEAKEQFQLVQQAWEVLSDSHERAWYDNHREAILKGGIGDDYKDDSIDLFQFFSSGCFKGYGDDEKGFYTVYRTAFEKLAAEDAEFSKEGDSDVEIPGFGNSQSSYEEEVHNFYAYWQSFSTKRSFAWLDPYDIRDTPNRRVLRLVEKENKKVRDKAKKERNEQVRNLVAFVRKRDKRVQAHGLKLAAKAKENVRKVEERKRQQLLERQKQLKEHVEPEWTKFSNIESELEHIEANLMAQFSETGSSDSEDKDSETDYSGSCYCVACNKLFKSPKSYSNHENSKAHNDNVALMKKEMEEDAKYNSKSKEVDAKDLENKNDKIHLATGPEMPDFLLNPPATDAKTDNIPTSDEELISDDDTDCKKQRAKGPSKYGDAGANVTDSLGGYILGKDLSRSQQNSKDGGTQTSEDELISDQDESDVVVKTKKQKKKKGKNVRKAVLDDDSDEEDQEVNLYMGLSKKQRRKQQRKEDQAGQSESVSKQSSVGEDVNIEKGEKSTENSPEDVPGKLSESNDSPQETVSPVPGKKKGKKAKELRKAQRQAAGEERIKNDRTRKTSKSLDRTRKASKSLDLPDKTDLICVTCKYEFSSKNRLFEHLRDTDHSVYLPSAATKTKKSADKKTKGQGKSNKVIDTRQTVISSNSSS